MGQVLHGSARTTEAVRLLHESFQPLAHEFDRFCGSLVERARPTASVATVQFCILPDYNTFINMN